MDTYGYTWSYVAMYVYTYPKMFLYAHVDMYGCIHEHALPYIDICMDRYVHAAKVSMLVGGCCLDA